MTLFHESNHPINLAMAPIAQTVFLIAFLIVTAGARADHADQTPLPPMDTIIKHAIEHSKKEPENDRLFQQRYEFIRTKVTEYRNGDGELTKREQKANTNHVRIASAATKP